MKWMDAKLEDIVSIKYGKDISTKQIIANDKFPVFGANGIIGFYKKYGSSPFSVHEKESSFLFCANRSMVFSNYGSLKT